MGLVVVESIEICLEILNFEVLDSNADIICASQFFKLHLSHVCVLSELIINLDLLLMHFNIFLGADILNLAADLNTVFFSYALKLFTVFSLHVLEHGLALNQNISDFNSLKPDAPALNDIKHLTADLLTKLLSLLQQLFS